MEGETEMQKVSDIVRAIPNYMSEQDLHRQHTRRRRDMALGGGRAKKGEQLVVAREDEFVFFVIRRFTLHLL